jgi:hypothetical protein
MIKCKAITWLSSSALLITQLGALMFVYLHMMVVDMLVDSGRFLIIGLDVTTYYICTQ